MTIEMKEFDNRAAAAHALAGDIEALLNSAVEHKDGASFVVSGGSSPLKVYEKLSNTKLDWSRIKVTLSDERCVKLSSDQSNAKMVMHQLMQNKAAGAQFFGLVSEAGKPLETEQVDALASEFSSPFDVTLLGMGEDGHIASLFPDAVEIEEAIIGDKFYYQLKPDHLKQTRVSLSASALLNSSNIKLLIFGQRKKELLEYAMSPGDALDLPVRVILQQQQVPVTVYWAE